ncbi:MAG: 4-hydroxy-tetrahydrodipicolinate reductase [Lachnospiraceae bacterium]|nr:4-hydroxy-tetrahydrodipicolinate reductase [Lachnospiraceae bacterium]
MTNVIMHGCNGRMGRMIASVVEQDENINIVAGVDVYDDGKNPFPVYKSIEECKTPADVVIDFSNAAAVDGLLKFCTDRKMPVVLCSTGLSPEQLDAVKAASEKVAVLKSANMSLGINMLIKVLRQEAAKLADEGYDIEIVEKHHNQKLDAPSGTALALADAINDSLDEKYDYVYDRSQRREKRPKNEIGISAIRGGTIVGDHDVIFAGTDEVITFSHTAYSRAVFAKGAVAAAKFLKGRAAGLYTMADVIG